MILDPFTATQSINLLTHPPDHPQRVDLVMSTVAYRIPPFPFFPLCALCILYIDQHTIVILPSSKWPLESDQISVKLSIFIYLVISESPKFLQPNFALCSRCLCASREKQDKIVMSDRCSVLGNGGRILRKMRASKWNRGVTERKCYPISRHLDIFMDAIFGVIFVFRNSLVSQSFPNPTSVGCQKSSELV